MIYRFIADDAAYAPTISALDRGFLLGDGVFDTMVAFAGRVFLLDRHIERLLRHAAAIGIEADATVIRQAIEDVLAETGDRHAILRATLTRGQAARGLWPVTACRPSLLVTAQPWSPSLLGQPARLCLGDIPRNQHSPLSRIKSLAYLDNILAARQAAEAGVDDTLIRNLDGNAVCTTIANLFAVVGGQLLTPPLADGCLDGIMRGLVLEEARAIGWHCRERSLVPSLLDEADTLFLTNSVRLIRPVAMLGDRTLPVSPMTAQLLSRLLVRIEHETAVHLDPAPASLP